jgi:serine/threonine protein kinase
MALINELNNVELELDQDTLLIEKMICATGFSHVFKARSTASRASMAVKIACPSTRAETALLNETEIMSAIKSRRVLPILASGVIDRAGSLWDGLPYITTPFADAGTLEDCTVVDEVTARNVVRIVSDAAHGLRDIHGQGYVHKDVKGANIFIRGNGGHIGDLGHAAHSLAYLQQHDIRVPAMSRLTGTLGYMSPEQFTGFPVTEAADAFGLGTTAIMALTGEYPWPMLQNLRGGMTTQSRFMIAYESALYGKIERNLPTYLSIDTRDAYYGCLVPEPGERPSMDILAELS